LENENSNRRGFIRKLAKLGAVGGVAALLSTEKTLIPTVQASPGALEIDIVNTGTGTTELDSSGGGTTFYAKGTAATGTVRGVVGEMASGTYGFGVEGRALPAGDKTTYGVCGWSNSTNGTGVLGAAYASSGTTYGVYGQSNSTSGIGVIGEAGNVAAKPVVARGYLGQTANLQEWQNSGGIALSVVDKIGWLGVGAVPPVSPIHVMIPVGQPASLIAIRAEGENRNVGAFFYSYSSGNFPFFSGRRARGTIASPSAVQANDLLMRYGGAGYGATSFPAGNRATLEFYAAENWTDTAQGTYVTIGTTPTGSTTLAERMRVTGDGNVVPPSDNTGSIGTGSKRWALVRAVTITPGDLIFENGYRLTEDKHSGISLLNQKGERIARFDEQGNIHIKGDLIKDL